MTSRTLVLGGGFGGIAAAVELKRLLGDDHEVVLVDRKPDFTMGLRKLWELVGHGTIAEGSRQRSLLAAPRRSASSRRRSSRSTPPRGAAETTGGRLDGDHLVIALGAVSRPDLVPGLAEHGHDVWAFAGVPAAAEALARVRRRAAAGPDRRRPLPVPAGARTSAPSTSTSTCWPVACAIAPSSRSSRCSRC